MAEIANPNTPPQLMPLVSDIWEVLDDPCSSFHMLQFGFWTGGLVVAQFTAFETHDVLRVAFDSGGDMGLVCGFKVGFTNNFNTVGFFIQKEGGDEFKGNVRLGMNVDRCLNGCNYGCYS